MVKRFTAVAAALVLIVSVLVLPTTALAYYEAYSCCSNGKPLNVRSGPGKDYPAIGGIRYGDPITVDHDLGNGWSEIFWGNQAAYVMTALMSRTYPGPYQPAPTQAPSTTAGAASLNSIFQLARFVVPYTVTLRGTRGSGSVNVRWAPSTDCSLLQTYAYGSTLQVIAEMGEWYQVVDPMTGITGFVMRKFAFR